MPGSSLTLILPIVPGKTEAWRRFLQALHASHRADYEASRRQLGITEEHFAMMETAWGAAVLNTIVADNVGEALTILAASTTPFDRWFKAQLSELHGLYLSDRPQVGKAVPLFTWQAPTASQD